MAAPMEDVSDVQEPIKDENLCTVEATVVTGFEPVAAEEAEERFKTKCKILRGRISIPCPIEKVEQVTDLGCVDNCRIVMKHISNFNFSQDQNDNLQRLRNLVGSIDWSVGLNVWRKFFSFEHGVADYPAEITTNFGEVVIPPPRQVTEGEKKSKRSKKRNKWKKKFGSKCDEKDVNETEAGAKSVDSEIGDTETTDTDKGLQKKQGAEGSAKSEDVSQTEFDTNGISSSKRNKGDEKQESMKGEEKDNTESVTKKPRVRENPWNPMMPTFRVTCYRVGDKHNFDSMTAAANFGGAIYRYFGWNVKMTEFDIEVILGIDDQEVTVSLGLTKESLHRRNITHFGPTTLRPTIAYGMLRLCDIKTGDIVCDPMSGTGSIPIQGALRWPYSLNIAGEIGKRALQRCHGNIQDIEENGKTENKSSLLIDAVRWDVCNLPVKDQSVDVFVTDLPFGVRMGHKVNNWTLYPGALFEMARVVKPETGRCCLLTEDKKCMIKTLQHIGKYWKRTKTLGVNIGGLAGGIYVLMRTAEPFDKHVNRDIFASKERKGDKSMVADSPGNSGDDI